MADYYAVLADDASYSVRLYGILENFNMSVSLVNWLSSTAVKPSEPALDCL